DEGALYARRRGSRGGGRARRRPHAPRRRRGGVAPRDVPRPRRSARAIEEQRDLGSVRSRGRDDAQAQDPPRRRQEVQEDGDREDQALEGLQEPHPDQEDDQAEARPGHADDGLEGGPSARRGHAPVRQHLEESPMPRVKRGNKRRLKRKKILRRAKGY